MDKVIEQLKEPHYKCAICRLVRCEILGRILNSKDDRNLNRIRAISDGITLDNISLCPDIVELESIGLNYLFTNHPVFTPLIGLESDEINEYLTKISTDFKKVDYCPYKPKNQKMNSEEVKKIYQSLDLTKLVTECIQDMEKIKII